MIFSLMPLAWAAKSDADLSGALDVHAAAYIPDSGPVISGAGWQAEGDLVFSPGGFRLTTELDFGGGLGPVFPSSLVYLSPERLSVQVGVRHWWFEGGILPPPWGLEQSDSWKNPLASWSVLRRPGIGSIQGAFGPDGLVPLGSIIGGGFGYTERSGGVVVLAGLDLPGGMNFLGTPLEDVRNSTLIVGGQGFYRGRDVVFNGGLYGHPADFGPLVLDLGVQFRPELVWVSVEGAAALNGTFGVMALGEFLPGGEISPVVRVEMGSGGLGGSLGLCGNFWDFLRVKAEARYSEGMPSLWGGVSIFVPDSRVAPSGPNLGW